MDYPFRDSVILEEEIGGEKWSAEYWLLAPGKSELRILRAGEVWRTAPSAGGLPAARAYARMAFMNLKRDDFRRQRNPTRPGN